MNVYEEFMENEKKIGILLDLIFGFELDGTIKDISLEERKYRRKMEDKVDKLGIKAFDLEQYTDDEKPFMKRILDKYYEIQNKLN